jgi:hypothetical protein
MALSETTWTKAAGKTPGKGAVGFLRSCSPCPLAKRPAPTASREFAADSQTRPGPRSSPHRLIPSPQRFLVAYWLLVAVCGCGPAPDPQLAPVRGQISFDGTPLDHGSLTLRPDGPDKSWEHPTGMIGPDGVYTVYTGGKLGAPPGMYRVVVFVTEETDPGDPAHPGMPKSIIPARYNDPELTPLRLDVMTSAPAGAYSLELVSDAP